MSGGHVRFSTPESGDKLLRETASPSPRFRASGAFRVPGLFVVLHAPVSRHRLRTAAAREAADDHGSRRRTKPDTERHDGSSTRCPLNAHRCRARERVLIFPRGLLARKGRRRPPLPAPFRVPSGAAEYTYAVPSPRPNDRRAKQKGTLTEPVLGPC